MVSLESEVVVLAELIFYILLVLYNNDFSLFQCEV